jgi:glucoamylase
VYMTGNITELGNWDTSSGYPLVAYLYTESENLWFGSVEMIPPGTVFEYKYYKSEPDGSVTFEGGDNRIYTIPTGCPIQPQVHDVWQT